MFQQPRIGFSGPSLNAEGFLSRVGMIVAYAVLVFGYLQTVLEASSLTVSNLLIFTALQVLYALLLVWFFKDRRSARQLLIISAVLTAITVVRGLLYLIGLPPDLTLYLLTVTIYCIAFSLRSAIIAVLLLCLASGLNVALVDHWSWNILLTDWVDLMTRMGFIALLLLLFQVLSKQRKQAEDLVGQLACSREDLEQMYQQLQRSAVEAEELTIMRERTRLAREMHDTLGHYLSILHIQLETVSKYQQGDPVRASQEVAQARQVVAQAMQELRNAVAALRSTPINAPGLRAALAQLGNEFECAASGTSLVLDLDTPLPVLSPKLQVALYRAAQEALTNVRKHARANKVLLRLRYEDESLELVVLNNECGTIGEHTEQSAGGFGLLGLRERFELLGGQVIYGPSASGGYRVAVRVPVPMVTSVSGEERHD